MAIVRHYLIKIERMEQLRSMMRLDPTSVECRSGVVTPRPHFQSMQGLTIVNEVFAFLCFNAGNDARLQAALVGDLTGEGSKMKSAPLGDHNRRHFLRALGSTFVAAGAVVAVPIPEAETYDRSREETRARYRKTEDVRAFGL